MESSVVALSVGEAAAPLRSVQSVEAVAGRGLKDDRYHDRDGTWSDRDKPGRQITLIEIEAIEALARDYGMDVSPGDTRRNVATRGVALNHLVGKEFIVGQARLRGTGLCEPCNHLESLTTKGMRRALVHRGGLNAEIVVGGTISVGDTIEVVP